MAQEPKFNLEGNEITNVLEVQYILRNEADKDGRPTRKQFFEGILIRRIGDDSTALQDWARSPKEENRKAGDIQFYSDTGKETKKLEFKGAYLKEFRVDFDERDHHVEEIIQIQPEVVSVSGIEINFNWPDQ